MKFKDYLQLFFAICTFSMIGSAGFLTFSSVKVISTSLMWQIAAISLVASSFTAIFHSKKELSRKAHLIRHTIHFLLINLLFFTSAYLFDWGIYASPKTGVLFAIIIFIIYFIITLSIYVVSSTKARKLNTMLNEYQNKRRESNVQHN